MRLLIVDEYRKFAAADSSVGGADECWNEVTYARDCAAASRRIEAGEHFDAVLVDGNATGAGGLSGVADLCAACPDLPVVTVTADPDPGIALCAIRAGVRDTLRESEATPPAVRRVLRRAIDRHRYEARLRDTILRDPLTGLLNRRGTRKALASAMRSAADNRLQACAFVALDIDDFKSIDRRFGRVAGNDLLALCGQRIAESIRSCDHVGRTDRHEFGIIFRRVHRRDAVLAMVEAVATACAKPFDLGGEGLSISVSIGISTCPDDEDTHPLLVKSSGLALVEARRRGGNQHVFYRDMMRHAAARDSLAAPGARGFAISPSPATL